VHWVLKKIPVVTVPDQPYFFLLTLLFFQRDWPCDPIFSGWLQAAAKMASVVTLIIEKTMKKIFKKKFISDLPTLIFSRYDTGTTGIFFYVFLQFYNKKTFVWMLSCVSLLQDKCINNRKSITYSPLEFNGSLNIKIAFLFCSR
jgi:hypothetical protein